jgi:glycosyltransferase involved in cell wall biosynthesis
MRILILSTDGIPVPPEHYGGIERIVAEVGGGLVRRGHEVALLAASRSRLDGVQCGFWKTWPVVPDAVGYGIQALLAARRFRADLIHSFGQTKWLLPWCLTGGRAVISFGALPQTRVRQMLRPFRNRLLLAGCSNYLSSAGTSIVGGRWRTAYNCVDLHRYEFERSVAPNAPLVFLSRIDANKGVHVAIEIAERSGRRLIIAGNRADSGDSGRYWREVVEPRLKNPGIDYVGPINDAQKNRLLGQAAALVVPIQWDEPFGVVFIEALACGTPVISCARGALPEIVRDGVEGFLGNTAEELAGAVARLGEIDRQACRRRVEECFSTERIVDTYEKLYLELLARNPVQA